MVTFIPNIAGKRYKEDSFISGELIKKAKVTPKGIPAPINPIKRGIDEQEQKGVTVPSSAPITFAQTPLNLLSIFLVFSGEKYD